MNVRSPAVAGAFYPLSQESVLSQLRELFGYWDIDFSSLDKRKRVACKGVVVPHAGWDYSGYVAARVLADIPKVDTIVLMGPNHTGMGPNFSVSKDDEWETPLGKVGVDRELADELVGGVAEMDEMAHIREHSIEVQLPLLQSVLKEFKIIPIAIKHYVPDSDFLGVCREFGEVFGKALKGKNALIVCSTDFTHYEPLEVAEKKDAMAIKEIEKLDEEGLFKTVNENKISMCGYAGVAAGMVACKALGAKKAEKVAYMTSAETTLDTTQVVGYGGLRIL